MAVRYSVKCMALMGVTLVVRVLSVNVLEKTAVTHFVVVIVSWHEPVPVHAPRHSRKTPPYWVSPSV
jgi:hypothetical protein